MKQLKHHFDLGTIFVVAITLVLFILALFTKGLTHDLLLEAGVFLVSVKLILMSYKNKVYSEHLHSHLEEVESLLKDIKKSL